MLMIFSPKGNSEHINFALGINGYLLGFQISAAALLPGCGYGISPQFRPEGCLWLPVVLSAGQHQPVPGLGFRIRI
jgi:hypothetical protein